VPAQAPSSKPPLVPPNPPASDNSIPKGLIKSTNADERAKQVQASIDAQKGRKDKDPFNSIAPTVATTSVRQIPQTKVPDVANLPSGAPSRAEAPPRPSSPLPSVPRSRPANSTPLPPANSNSQSPNDPPASPPIATLPPLPEPTIARGIEVTGVVQVGGQSQAIVKAPNEPTSRYVSVGQRIANGQVLVKRIDLNSGAEPTVILEENGVEVAKAIASPTRQTGRPA
jgi:hypothetical protein